MTAGHLEALAGATLDHVTVDWRNGTARLTFLPGKNSHEPHAIRVSELHRLHVDRTKHASPIVKEATRAGSGHHAKVSLTMESGEALVIEAGAIVLEPAGG
jgi:hypothetical protein